MAGVGAALGETPVDGELSFRELTAGPQANVAQLLTTGASRWSSPGHPAARPNQRLRFVEGSSYSPAVIERVRRWLGRDRFDFLFIDGDHSYSGVVQDFLAYYPMVRPGGLIAVHDIAPDELGRFGTRSPGSMIYGGEVFLLWRRLRERFPHEMFVQSWDQYGYGIGVITKPDDSPLPQDWVTSLQNSDVARSMTIQ